MIQAITLDSRQDGEDEGGDLCDHVFDVPFSNDTPEKKGIKVGGPAMASKAEFYVAGVWHTIGPILCYKISTLLGRRITNAM